MYTICGSQKWRIQSFPIISYRHPYRYLDFESNEDFIDCDIINTAYNPIELNGLIDRYTLKYMLMRVSEAEKRLLLIPGAKDFNVIGVPTRKVALSRWRTVLWREETLPVFSSNINSTLSRCNEDTLIACLSDQSFQSDAGIFSRPKKTSTMKTSSTQTSLSVPLTTSVASKTTQYLKPPEIQMFNEDPKAIPFVPAQKIKRKIHKRIHSLVQKLDEDIDQWVDSYLDSTVKPFSGNSLADLVHLDNLKFQRSQAVPINRSRIKNNS